MDTRFSVTTDSKIYCLNASCVNNISQSCNLKGIHISEAGICAGIVRINKTKLDKITKDNKT